MAKYTAMIANGGNNLDVTIVKSVNNPDGTQLSRNDINSYVNSVLGGTGNSGSDLNIDPELINAVKQGMRGVTSDDGGTAVQYFRNFNIEVGGKTGSATTNQGTNSWFVGFAPFDNPEIAVAVYVKNGRHGAYTAPVARDIFAQYFGMNDQQIMEDVTASSAMFSVR
jgi:penicillin-binding protein 2